MLTVTNGRWAMSEPHEFVGAAEDVVVDAVDAPDVAAVGGGLACGEVAQPASSASPSTPIDGGRHVRGWSIADLTHAPARRRSMAGSLH